MYKETSKLYAKLLFFPLKYDSYYVNIFIKIQVRLYQRSIRSSLEKKAGPHRSFFLGYKDAHQKRRFKQGFFTPDTKLYSSLRNVLHVTVVIDTKPKVKGELQTVIENFANS